MQLLMLSSCPDQPTLFSPSSKKHRIALRAKLRGNLAEIPCAPPNALIVLAPEGRRGEARRRDVRVRRPAGGTEGIRRAIKKPGNQAGSQEC